MKTILAGGAAMLASMLAAAPATAAGPATDGAFTFRLGGFFPSGDSEFWEVNEAAFTLDHSDFDGVIGGVGYTASVNNHFEVGVNIDFYAAESRSADRFFEDEDGFPILHDTRLGTIPMTVDFKLLPAGRFARRGADGSRYVRRPAFYLGAGAGLVYWKYEEEGDFVASDLSIVYDRLTDTGLEFEYHAFAGCEFPVSPNWNITVEVRQSWAEATPGGSFAIFDAGELDLGGTSVFVGGALRF